MTAPESLPEPLDAKTIEILVVDDSRTQVELLKYLLELQNYRVSVAVNGQEALAIVRENRPAMVISDIVMPVMDGYQMCAQIKDDPVFGYIPVILLTQLAEPEDIVRGLHAHADYYLTKPYKPEYLLSKVKALLENPPSRKTEEDVNLDKDLQVTLDGKNYVVNADRQQMLNLLFSTYENAVQQNRELISTQRELKATNEQLNTQMKLLHEAREELERNQEALIAANSKLEALAVTDGLTGLKNHRAFKEKLDEYFRYGARYGSAALSLILLDVDRFKQFNDTFGHPAGDEVLKQVARLLEGAVRQADFVARYGGEEFAVLLPHTDEAESRVSAERVRAAIESAPWPQRAITVSLGIATTIPNEEGRLDRTTLIAAADKALYVSKAGGRNRWAHDDDGTEKQES